MKKVSLFTMVVSALLFYACGSDSKPEQSTTEQTPVSGSADNMEKETTANTAVCIWQEVGIREAADHDSKYLTSIFLGEEVFFYGETKSVTEEGKDVEYSEIILKDGTEGWIRSIFIVPAGKIAVVLNETAIYKRPDILTKSNQAFRKMDVISIKPTGEADWLKVIGKSQDASWFYEGYIKSVNVTDNKIDVAVATYYLKAMAIKDEAKRKAALEDIVNNSDLQNSSFIKDLREIINPEAYKTVEEDIITTEEDTIEQEVMQEAEDTLS